MIHITGLVPVYDNPLTIERVARSVLVVLEHLIVVDDGSDEPTRAILDRLAGELGDRFTLVRHAVNCGKGAAVQSGLRRALELGFTHAIQIDGDGQHALEDLPRFVAAVQRDPTALVVGTPIYGRDIPAIRKHGRKLTQWMIALEMGRWRVPDAMIGFRAYPVAAICALGRLDTRMSFDPQVMIRAFWAGLPLVAIETAVRYPLPEEGGISHFRMVRDNIGHTWLHLRLLPQAPFRLLLRKLHRSGA